MVQIHPMPRGRHRWILRWILRCLGVSILMICTLIAKAWHDTMRDPVVERLAITSTAMPQGARPLRIVLVADIHVAGPDMPPQRLERIVGQINALRPDLIAIAGDLVSEKRTATRVYTPEEVVSPLGGLEAPLGVALVPGNHDHWFDWPALADEIAKHPRITVLANEAAQFGPLAVGGVDDAFTRRDDLAATLDAARSLTGPRILITHSPDIFPRVPQGVQLVLAGHTHCGQIAYPWGGSPATMSRYGDAYACGVVKRGTTTLVTSGGLGTSVLPFRLFTRPELWVIEIKPPQR